MKRFAYIFVLSLGSASWTAHGQEVPNLTLGKVWAEQTMGNPERGGPTGHGLTPMPESAYRFANGAYQSIVSRIKLKLPKLGDEKQVSVREAVISRRPDGAVITSHVVFIPGAFSMTGQTEAGISAVVVTRLRDDRPKDAESVLKSWHPRSDEERMQQEKNGIWHARVKTSLGNALQRVIENRLADDPFPYRTNVRMGGEMKSVGVSRFVVIEGDSFIEFSQIFPCRALDAARCKTNALEASDRFIAGVSEFLTYPKNSVQKLETQ